jgi:NADH-quinone oxidoreductase subunit I
MSSIYGKGIVQSLWLVFKHFVDSYVVDIRDLLKRKSTADKVAFRSSAATQGLFTIEYPEVKTVKPEEFRFLPFLVYDIDTEGAEKQRCTACGTCARVCPPQCIWIERAKDPATGKPVPAPASFVIDSDLCMNCGLCAEYCPFDAIQMDHHFELASTTRKHYLLDLKHLSRPAAYYQQVKPVQYAREQAAKEAKAKPAE